MEVLTSLLDGFSTSLTLVNLFACFMGVLMGTLTGILPGLGPSAAMALLLPFSFGLSPTTSLIMLAGIYYGAMYGGSTTSILVNIPGEAASVVTCIDGYQMAKKGRGGAALSVSAIGSWVAGTFGIVGLMLFAPKLAELALKFGPPEYFAVALIGLVVLANLTGGNVLKSGFMVFLGMMAASVGKDTMTGFGRITFGMTELSDGLQLVPVLMGLFGFAEVLSVINKPSETGEVLKPRLRDLYPTKNEIKRSILPILRGTVIGFPIGLLPGPAATISAFISYKIEKLVAKNKDEFGKGAIEGVAGPESANNAASSGTMVPLFALGLPFAPTSAVLISGLMIHGITPGPTFITDHADILWAVIASMYIGNVMLLVLNLPLVGLFASIVKVPTKILMPMVSVFMFVGAYSLNNRLFDVGVLIAFGIVGFIMRIADFDPAPMIIGFILGPVMEVGLRQGLGIVQGNFLTFFTRPITGTLLVICILVLLWRAGGMAIKLLTAYSKRRAGASKVV